MNCIIEARQFKQPAQENLAQPIFFIDTSIHYEVHYLPNNLYFNLKSHRECVPFPLQDGDSNDHLRRILFTTLLSRTLIPKSDFDSILIPVFSKLKSIASNPSNSGYDFIPLSMSIRVIRTQEYNVEAKRTWQWMLDVEKINSKLPAKKESVRKLKMVVCNGEDSGSECPICLKEFKTGEEMTMMPCFHCYHGECINEWLKNSHQCPSCRFPLSVCRVDDGIFPFCVRKPGGMRVPPGFGDKIRKTTRTRMSDFYQVY
ncbi:RING/U-box superfamily protein [Euphorbia peplus]|nr:RING/U-box superfamily protein [Euphorbia peplus]